MPKQPSRGAASSSTAAVGRHRGRPAASASSYTVVLAGLVPMQKSDGDHVKQMALYVAIGVLAGFTERFAQDMFVRSGNGLQGVMGDSPSTGPSAGLAPPPGAQVDAVRG